MTAAQHRSPSKANTKQERMSLRRLPQQNNKRKAFFVLTKDRPQSLRSVLSELDKEQSKNSPLVFVLDSSTMLSTETGILNTLSQTFRAHVIRLAVPQLIRNLSSLFPETTKIIGSTSAPIARCRNLALLVAIGFGITEVFFLDDDTTGFSKSAPYREFLRGSLISSENRVIGAHIGGIDSRDQMTRLTMAFCNLKKSKECRGELARERLITVNTNLYDSSASFRRKNEKLVDHVSGGFACCSFDYSKILPFPAVYNEFWIWCFLQSCIHHTIVKLSPSWILHKHPLPQVMKVESIVEEQIGIFFYKLLRTLRQRLTDISDLLGPPIVPMEIKFFSPHERVSKILTAMRHADARNLRKACAVLGLDESELDGKLMSYLQEIDPNEIAVRLWRAYAEQIRTFYAAIPVLKNSQAVIRDMCLSRMD